MVRRDWAQWIMGAMLCGLAALAWWKWAEWQQAGAAGAAYAARITCSCRYVGGRDARSCAQDIREDAWAVSVRDEPEAKAVSASVPLLGRARALFRPGYGCVMEDGPQPR